MVEHKTVKKIQAETEKYPEGRQQSAILYALNLVQHDNNGFLTTKLMDEVAELLEMPKVSVYEVATFYSMLETTPCGRNNVAICTNISCMLRGSDDIVKHVEGKLGIKLGESTEDGRIYLKKGRGNAWQRVAGAPMMQVNHIYHENLTIKKLMKFWMT